MNFEHGRMPQEEIVAIHKRSEELKSLLAEYGWELHAFDPGVLISDKKGTLIFAGSEWSAIEPLLWELKNFRENEQGKQVD